MLKRNPAFTSTLEAALDQRNIPSTATIGLFRNEEAALQFIRDRLVFSLRPESIWLFGSRARREHRPDSDFDILVVLPDDLGAKAKDYRFVLEPVLGSGLPCEIVPCPLSDFEQAKDISGTIAHEAFHSGRQLYQKRQPVSTRTVA